MHIVHSWACSLKKMAFLSEAQFGLRKGISTVGAFQLVVEHLSDALEKIKVTFNLFYRTKAFDFIPYNNITTELEYYWIRKTDRLKLQNHPIIIYDTVCKSLSYNF